MIADITFARKFNAQAEFLHSYQELRMNLIHEMNKKSSLKKQEKIDASNEKIKNINDQLNVLKDQYKEIKLAKRKRSNMFAAKRK